jgi:hypothetical protein
LLNLIIVTAYKLSFASSQETVVRLYLSELFPPQVRGKGQGFSVRRCTGWRMPRLFCSFRWCRTPHRQRRSARVVLLSKTGTASEAGQPWRHPWFAGALPGKLVVVVYVPHGDGGNCGGSGREAGGRDVGGRQCVLMRQLEADYGMESAVRRECRRELAESRRGRTSRSTGTPARATKPPGSKDDGHGVTAKAHESHDEESARVRVWRWNRKVIDAHFSRNP